VEESSRAVFILTAPLLGSLFRLMLSFCAFLRTIIALCGSFVVCDDIVFPSNGVSWEISKIALRISLRVIEKNTKGVDLTARNGFLFDGYMLS